jgi:hypothetical protein
LKSQVQVAPFSLSMVSVLLAVVAALPVELLPGLAVEPAPALQPAASAPAPMMTPNLMRRLMPLVLTVCDVTFVSKRRG